MGEISVNACYFIYCVVSVWKLNKMGVKILIPCVASFRNLGKTVKILILCVVSLQKWSKMGFVNACVLLFIVLLATRK